MPRGRKLVVQMVETFREHMQPAFVEKLDAWELAETAGMELPPVMIYGDDVTHILTEEGIANLLLCRSDEEREQAIRGVAGYTAVGLGARQAHGREPARPRRDPAGRGPRHRQAAGHARPAGGALGQGPGARLGRSLRPAQALPQLVSGSHGNLAVRIRNGRPVAGSPSATLTGVVGSGNLEVLLEPAELGGACRIEIKTAARGFGPIWQAVLGDFHARHPLADVRISINDIGATPAVVSLRLDQAVESFAGSQP